MVTMTQRPFRRSCRVRQTLVSPPDRPLLNLQEGGTPKATLSIGLLLWFYFVVLLWGTAKMFSPTVFSFPARMFLFLFLFLSIRLWSSCSGGRSQDKPYPLSDPFHQHNCFIFSSVSTTITDLPPIFIQLCDAKIKSPLVAEMILFFEFISVKKLT